MTPTISADLNIVAILFTLVGWAFSLGIMWQTTRGQKEIILRLQTDVEKMDEKIEKHHENARVHTSDEWRQEVKTQLAEISRKVDSMAAIVNTKFGVATE